MGYYVGIDLGGTNVAVGIVDENYNIIGRANVRTKAFHPAGEIADDMAVAAHMAAANAGISMDEVVWVGVGTPGTVNPRTGVVGLAANLGFHDTPLGELVAERVDKPVYVENDANAAAYGELKAGAAKGLDSAIMITLGTGVGGGIIIDGKSIPVLTIRALNLDMWEWFMAASHAPAAASAASRRIALFPR